MAGIYAKPISLKEANEYVDALHRHHHAVVRDKFRVAAYKDGELCGVAQVGRPVARMLDDGSTVEVVRCCSNGERNVCSFLYSRCARIAAEMGYSKIITYILESESGVSLKASGFELEAVNVGGGEWGCKSRERAPASFPTCKKQRWAKILNRS